MQEFEAEKDGFTIDFDHRGYMRDEDKYHRLRSSGVLDYDDEDVSKINEIYLHFLHDWEKIYIIMQREYYESLQAEGLDISGPTH